MNSEYKYEVRGYCKQSDLPHVGSQVEIGCHTVNEAKVKARFVLTQGEMLQTEAPE